MQHELIKIHFKPFKKKKKKKKKWVVPRNEERGDLRRGLTKRKCGRTIKTTAKPTRLGDSEARGDLSRKRWVFWFEIHFQLTEFNKMTTFLMSLQAYSLGKVDNIALLSPLYTCLQLHVWKNEVFTLMYRLNGYIKCPSIYELGGGGESKAFLNNQRAVDLQ